MSIYCYPQSTHTHIVNHKKFAGTHLKRKPEKMPVMIFQVLERKQTKLLDIRIEIDCQTAFKLKLLL